MWKSVISERDEPHVRTYAEILKQKQDDEGYQTTSSIRQDIIKLYKLNNEPVLTRQKHIQFLKKSLFHLTEAYQCLDSSRPWLCYWSLHSLQILGERLEYDEYSRIIAFLAKCQSPEEDGSFIVHKNGETDIRGIYCALSVAKLTNVYTPEIFKGSESWIAKCQTWEGGFGGSPGMEAHGGYGFCGGAFPLIHTIFTMENKIFNSSYWLFNQEALQEYILICCQHPHGSLVDKPGKSQDVYHTCYALCGLSIAQNSPWPLIIGSANTNLVKIIHPLYNLENSCAVNALKYFNTLPILD
ncbi:Protein farnesyltransferase subunit beta [Melipona quadrifasciata]|uniref:Protein farnesyltransferase subunit beta n=1 Tax=Melipona quadrifasciata TaxID=166423 RepID=A0A0M9A988_9HYME|nr:Protein farnesyltransferase subunit beta [Melipona quadrifasciata]